MLDIRIEGGKIYDGTGNPWYRADVGIKDGRIAAIGVVTERARKKIRADGFAVCPGFIDVHTHAERIVDCPTADNVLRQGVTTVIAGNCGGSGFPIRDALRKVRAARPAINYATLVGHGTVRRRVMGMAKRKPNRRELAEMRRLVEQAMREGAVGMSTGLFYVPGAYAKVEEIVEVAKVVSAHGGVYASHKRSSAGKLFQALREAATIGKRANIPVEISHLKALHKTGQTKRDRADKVLAAISGYRERGIEMTYDVYPYSASFTSLAAVAIPSWVSKDGELGDRLRDGAIRKRIRSDVAANIGWVGGPDKITIATFPPDRSLEGRSLADVARSRKRNAITTAMDMIVEGTPTRASKGKALDTIMPGAPRCIFHAMRPEDVRKIVCSENGMIGSDGGVVASRKGVVHPRNYGTFPRVLRVYVREEKLMSLEEAVRKMTSLPARKFAIADRGMIAVGMKADIVVFNPKTVSDRATFDRPHAFPVGINCVIVNGSVAWNGRAISRRRTGTVIRKR